MGEEDQPDQSSSAPAVILARNAGAQIGLALVVMGLVLATIGVLSDAWLVERSGDTDIEVGLFSTTFGNETQNHGDLYSNCTKMMDGLGANESSIEDVCGTLKSLHNAGFIGSIFIWSGIATLFVASFFQIKSFTGNRSKLTTITSLLGGGLIGIGVITWYLMLPESTDNPDLGYALWFCVTASSFGIIAGFSGTLQSLLDGPPRMRANGVRSGTDMGEFVLKESSCGDNTLSILCDDDLIRVVKIERRGAIPSVSDLLATRRDAYTGFSHQRMDWLDDMRGIWWVLAGAGLISTFTISPLFSLVFIIGSLLALAQLMDPERFVISTNSGDHSFIINRWRSNRELTNLSMDLVDEAMIAVLRGEDLDTDKIDNRAGLIAERFRTNAEEEQKELAKAPEPKPEPQPEPVAVPAPAQVAAPAPPPASEPAPPSAAVAPVAIPPPPAAVPDVQPPPPTVAPVATPPPSPVTLPPPPTLPPIAAPPASTMMPPPPPMAQGLPAMMPPPPPTMAQPMMTPTPAVLPPPPPMVVQAGPREENLSTDEKDGLMGDLID